MTGQLTVSLCIIWTLVTTAASILTSDTMSWRDAVEFCAKNRKILRKERLGLNEVVSERFWTRIYKKEHFVYLIGCFQPSQIKISTSTSMTEAECRRCLNQQPFMFAMNMSSKNTWCSCVNGTVPDLPGRCEVSKHVFVFGANDGKQKRKHCVQVKCNGNIPTLRKKECHVKRNSICNNKVRPGEFTWQKATERCKMDSGRLDIKIDDFCKTNNTKAWFGFGTVTSEEDFIEHSESLEPKRCQSCAKDCTFDNCSERRQAICETIGVTVENRHTSVNLLYPTTMRPLPTLTSSGEWTQYVTPDQLTTNRSQKTTVLTSRQGLVSQRITITSVLITNQTTHNVASDGSITRDTNVNIKMVLIYTASPLLAAILIVLCVLYMRSKRKCRRKEDLSRQPVREQLYELADNSQLENTVNDQDRVDDSLSAEDPINPGSGQREDIYNHLRERSVDASHEGEEDVYSRCIGGDDDNATYDVTCQNKFQFPTRDSVYNHVILFDSSTR